ncbi:type II secretion system minor pseudopilin GspK [Gayadomonas joobiniege]|uniref:type II secretion system minor pseudopilin GspK n=1 Tax=Gayadomonas joobiniege TaxID=1234606 RepID=UPI00037F0F12|nr:type II secretion system minor pseudopilin GspK [Gayadomonas joobiniege]
MMRPNKGVALITVLLIVALVTIIAAEMAVRMQMQIKRVDNISSNQQAYWYAIAGESLARLALTEAYKENAEAINLNQPWAVEEQSYPIENGAVITGTAKDLQSCFNLNAVVVNEGAEQSDGSLNDSNTDEDSSQVDDKKALNPTRLEQFTYLLENIGIDNYEAEALRDSVADWLDADSQTRSYGAEDYFYEAKAAPYLPANGMFADASELRLVKGFDSPPNGYQYLQDLLEHACVIPSENEMILNVNTIKAENAEVLAAMFNNKLTVTAAREVIESRPDDGFNDINDFWNLPEIKAVGQISSDFKKQFATTSRYFQLFSKTEYNNSWISLTSLLARDQQGKFVVLARKIGV